MIFSDFREYIPGDDVRSISWNLTARMSQPYIKTFEEDKEAPNHFGSGCQLLYGFWHGKAIQKRSP